MMNIIEMTEASGQLYINLGIVQNNENMGSCSYDRTYRLYPYSSELSDEIVVDLGTTVLHKVTGTRLPFKDREDKVPFEQYGYHAINGVESVMLRRVYPKPHVTPTI